VPLGLTPCTSQVIWPTGAAVSVNLLLAQVAGVGGDGRAVVAHLDQPLGGAVVVLVDQRAGHREQRLDVVALAEGDGQQAVFVVGGAAQHGLGDGVVQALQLVAQAQVQHVGGRGCRSSTTPSKIRRKSARTQRGSPTYTFTCAVGPHVAQPGVAAGVGVV
jgi:hypothetical protein